MPPFLLSSISPSHFSHFAQVNLVTLDKTLICTTLWTSPAPYILEGSCLLCDPSDYYRANVSLVPQIHLKAMSPLLGHLFLETTNFNVQNGWNTVSAWLNLHKIHVPFSVSCMSLSYLCKLNTILATTLNSLLVLQTLFFMQTVAKSHFPSTLKGLRIWR